MGCTWNWMRVVFPPKLADTEVVPIALPQTLATVSAAIDM
jgi:hypothetical protein